MKQILALTAFLLRIEADGGDRGPGSTRIGIAAQSRSCVSPPAHSLSQCERTFGDVGSKIDYGGPHANGVTHMALLGFEGGSYLELIAPQKAGAVEASDWAKWRG